MTDLSVVCCDVSAFGENEATETAPELVGEALTVPLWRCVGDTWQPNVPGSAFDDDPEELPLRHRRDRTAEAVRRLLDLP